MSRERMSRPTGSVPRMKRAVPPAPHTGGVNVKSRYCSFGGCGAMTFAKIAISTSAMQSPSPISAPRLCAYARQNSLSGPTGAGSSVAMGATSGMANPRVDDAVDRVDQEVHRDHDGGDEQNAALHDRVVPRLHPVDQPVADAGPREDGFGQDRAGQ